MKFNFLNGIGVKELSNGDVLTAIKDPREHYLVRSVLSPHEQPFRRLERLISFLTLIGEMNKLEINYTITPNK